MVRKRVVNRVARAYKGGYSKPYVGEENTGKKFCSECFIQRSKLRSDTYFCDRCEKKLFPFSNMKQWLRNEVRSRSAKSRKSAPGQIGQRS